MSLLARLVNPPGQKGGLGPVIAQGQGADVGGALGLLGHGGDDLFATVADVDRPVG